MRNALANRNPSRSPAPPLDGEYNAAEKHARRSLPSSALPSRELPALEGSFSKAPPNGRVGQPETALFHAAKRRSPADQLTMCKVDTKPFERLGADGEQRLGRAVAEGRSAMIAALGAIPLCSGVAVDHYPAQSSDDALATAPAGSGVRREDRAPINHCADEANDRLVVTADADAATDLAGPAAAQVRDARETVRYRVDRLRAQLHRVRQTPIDSPAGKLERTRLASEFERLDPPTPMLFRLIRAICPVVRRLSEAGQGLSDTECRRMEGALAKLEAISGNDPRSRPSLGNEAAVPSTASRTNKHDIAQQVGLTAEQLIERLEMLAAAAERFIAARERLLRANVGLIIHVARQFPGNAVDFSDLLQEGNIGLLKAVEKFDYRFGCRFSTYAIFWIRLAISRAMNRQQRIIPLPYRYTARLSMIARASQDIAQQNGSEPSFGTVAGRLNMSEALLNQTLAAAQWIVSFDQSGQDETDIPSLYNTLEQSTFPAPVEIIARQTLRTILFQAIGSLDAREARIVGCHFGITQENEQTLQALGEEMNISRERVRQIKVKALERLRKRFGDVLRPFLEES